MDQKTRYDFEKQLKRYQQGQWTKGVPSEPGVYDIRATGEEYGRQGGLTVVVYEIDGKCHLSDAWGAWIWSVPRPDLPPTPDVPGFEQDLREVKSKCGNCGVTGVHAVDFSLIEFGSEGWAAVELRCPKCDMNTTKMIHELSSNGMRINDESA